MPDPAEDPRAEAPAEVASESPEQTSAGGVTYTASEKASVTDLLNSLEVPAFLQYWYNRFYYDRKYVSDDALLLDDKDTVSVNYLYRNTQILTANLLARDPQLSFRADEIAGEPPPQLNEYAKTLGIIVKKLLRDAGMRPKLNAAIADASGVGWSIFKVTPQEDFRLDPIGNQRRNDELDNVARFLWMRERFQASDFTTLDAEYQEMQDLEAQVAAFMKTKVEQELTEQPPTDMPMIDPVTGEPMVDAVLGTPLTQPDPQDPRLVRLMALEAGQVPPDIDISEIGRYIGVIIDRVMPEDFRFDWQVTDPVELRRQCRWMAHRVYMDRNAFGAKFRIPVQDWKGIHVFDQAGRRLSDRFWQSDPAIRAGAGAGLGMDQQLGLNDRAAVWEIWHKERGVVYTVVEGLPYPLRVDASPIVWREWFPFFFLYFNRVDGRAIPMSDTLLTRNLQDEINRLRTQDLELRNFALPRVVIRRGSMTPDEKRRYENSYGGQVLEMAFADDVRAALGQPAMIQYDPRLSDINPAKVAMQEMSGITSQAMGDAGGDLATTAALADQYMGTQMDFRRFMLESLINDIGTCVADYANQILPEKNAMELAGVGAVWPMIRQEMARYLKLEVRAGSTGKPDLRKRKEFFQMLGPLCQQLSMVGMPVPVKGEAVIRELFESYEITDNPSQFILTAAEQMQQMAQQAAMGIVPGGAPGGQPGQLPASGMPGAATGGPPGAPGTPGGAPGEGAPTMAQRGAPKPESIPNSPFAGK